MLKPFIVKGLIIDGYLLKKVNENGLSRENVNGRVHQLGWNIKDACCVPKGKKPANSKKRLDRGLKVYYMDLEECHKKYGMPGQIMYPERQNYEQGKGRGIDDHTRESGHATRTRN